MGVGTFGQTRMDQSVGNALIELPTVLKQLAGTLKDIEGSLDALAEDVAKMAREVDENAARGGIADQLADLNVTVEAIRGKVEAL